MNNSMNLVDVYVFSEFIAPKLHGVLQAQTDAFDKEAVLYSTAVL